MNRRISIFCILWVLLSSISVCAQNISSSIDSGKKLFIASCAGCHGEDGTGGGLGPGILVVKQSRATSRDALRNLITKGILEVGMPAFPMPAPELESIIDYFYSLKAPSGNQQALGTSAPDGDFRAGFQFFNGKGTCSGCHSIHGQGGTSGPDLTEVIRHRSLPQIEQALKHPGSLPPVTPVRGARTTGQKTYRAVHLELKSGITLHGIILQETKFDLQFQGTDGSLHLLTPDQIFRRTNDGKSIMPIVPMTQKEKKDLLTYLVHVSSHPKDPDILPQTPVQAGISFSSIASPRSGEWPTYNGNIGGNRYSQLTQIHSENVSRLSPKWTFTLPGTHRPLETTPVVVDGIMYVTAANECYALDARTGRQIWRYARPRTEGLVPTGDAITGINRGVAILGARVFMVTDNAHLLALHRFTGQLLWEVEMADYRQNYAATAAPLVVNDLVISGISGGDEGVRGFLSAYKASTGERVWQFWTAPAPGEPGSETWVGDSIHHPGASTWMTGTYDSESGLLYWGVGNPGPDHNGDQRKGDNLYSCSILALDPATGKLRWYRQLTPHNLHDWDATQTPMVVNTSFQGRPRKLLVQSNRNGFFYVMDRLTGELLLAKPFIRNMTWATGVDTNGRPILVPGNEPTYGGTRVCPGPAGATNWISPAFDPTSNLYFVLAHEACAIFTKADEKFEIGKSFYGGSTRRAPGDTGKKYLRAIDLNTGNIRWEIADIGGMILESGLMATAGNLVFYGDNTGNFIAADSRNGSLLWHFNTNLNFKAGPMTYTSDGQQRVAIAAGSTIFSFGLPD